MHNKEVIISYIVIVHWQGSKQPSPRAKLEDVCLRRVGLVSYPDPSLHLPARKGLGNRAHPVCRRGMYDARAQFQ